MKQLGFVLLAFLLLGTFSYAQQASSAPAPRVIGHGAFPVKVIKTLDSSKLKEGDPVELETSGSFKLPDGTLVPKGSKLEGHVTVAQARSKGDPDSELNIAFEKLRISNDRQLSLKGIVQAVFPPQEEAEPIMAGKATAGAGGSSLGGGDVGTVTDSKIGSNMEASSQAEVATNPNSVGVQGIHGLELKNGILSSKGKNVKLGNGVRMIVRADIIG